MHVADGEAARDGLLRLKRRLGLLDQRVIQRLVQPMVLRLRTRRRFTCDGSVGENRIDERSMPLAFQCAVGDRGIDLVDAAHHLVHRAEAELGHVLPHLLGDEEEEVDHVLRLAL